MSYIFSAAGKIVAEFDAICAAGNCTRKQSIIFKTSFFNQHSRPQSIVDIGKTNANAFRDNDVFLNARQLAGFFIAFVKRAVVRILIDSHNETSRWIDVKIARKIAFG